MNQEVVILVADDDEGHAGLIQRNLVRAGVSNPFVHFADGQAVVDFLLGHGDGPRRDESASYVLLLDIRMPRLDGTEVLQIVKGHEQLRRMPVIMITTTDDPREIAHCHELGCNNYITKPVEYEAFVTAIRQLGLFLSIVQVPSPTGAE